MAQFKQLFDQDFTEKIEIHHCESVMFTGDDKGALVGVRLYDNGVAYSSGGTVTGAVKRSDGGLVALTGTLSGNAASVIIPAAALAYPGPIGVHIILNQGGSTTTVLKAIYSVDDNTGAAVDPGTIIPSVNDLITAINNAVASIPSDYSALLHTLAPDFSASTAYSAGDYVWYNGTLYRFTADHAAGAWAGTDATSAVVGNDLSDLKSAITFNQYAENAFMGLLLLNWMKGGLYSATGLDYSLPNIKTDFVDVSSSGTYIIYNPNAKPIAIFEYASKDGEKTKKSDSSLTRIQFTTEATTKYIRIMVASNPQNIDDAVNIILYNATDHGRIEEFFVLAGGTPNAGDYSTLADIPVGKIVGLTSTVINAMSDRPNQSQIGGATVFSLGAKNELHDGSVQIVSYWNGEMYYRPCSGGVFGAWNKIDVNAKYVEYINNKVGFIGSHSGSFDSQNQVIQTTIVLEANKTYHIKCNTQITGFVMVYGLGNTSSLKRISPWELEVNFKNDSTNRYLCMYNGTEYTGDISIDVYTPDSEQARVDNLPRKYTVSVNNSSLADYTSLSRCLIDLKNDRSPKIIEVWEGDYDIYAEYKELYTAGLLEKYQGTNPSMEYFPYCVWVPENTHIIGKGIVRLKWMPTAEQLSTDEMTAKQTKCIAPLNVAATATIENVEIYCKNGRYTLHNDGLGKSQFTGAVQKYINCKFFKYANDTDANSEAYGFTSTTGFGIDKAMHHEYDNCVFTNEAGGRAFYGHARDTVGGTSITETQSGEIILNGCAVVASVNPGVKLGNATSSNLHIRILFDNCYIDKRIDATPEGSSAVRNAFDMTFINCGDVSVHIEDSDTNRYEPKGYGTTITAQ